MRVFTPNSAASARHSLNDQESWAAIRSSISSTVNDVPGSKFATGDQTNDLFVYLPEDRGFRAGNHLESKVLALRHQRSVSELMN